MEKARSGNRLWAGTTKGNLYTYFDLETLLPLSDLHITANKTESAIKISWNDENFASADIYDVERSLDGILFTNLNRLNADYSRKYNCWDMNPKEGNNFYRILKRTPDGRDKYSATLRVNWKKNLGNITVAYPIANGRCRLLFNNMPPGTYTASLITSEGRIIANKVIVHTDNPIEVVNIGRVKGFSILRITGSSVNTTIPVGLN